MTRSNIQITAIIVTILIIGHFFTPYVEAMDDNKLPITTQQITKEQIKTYLKSTEFQKDVQKNIEDISPEIIQEYRNKIAANKPVTYKALTNREDAITPITTQQITKEQIKTYLKSTEFQKDVHKEVQKQIPKLSVNTVTNNTDWEWTPERIIIVILVIIILAVIFCIIAMEIYEAGLIGIVISAIAESCVVEESIDPCDIIIPPEDTFLEDISLGFEQGYDSD